VATATQAHTGIACRLAARNHVQAMKRSHKEAFPAQPNATPEEFRAVCAALCDAHGTPVRSKPPAEGCGGQTSVLDSFVRTILSQNTTDITSARAFASLKQQFPTWEDVRLARTGGWVGGGGGGSCWCRAVLAAAAARAPMCVFLWEGGGGVAAPVHLDSSSRWRCRGRAAAADAVAGGGRQLQPPAMSCPLALGTSSKPTDAAR
jgi:hypothetical protein